MKTVLPLFFFFGPILSFGQGILPMTPAPVSSPPPPAATNRIVTDDSLDMFPRWHPYVMVDAELKDGGIRSKIITADLAVGKNNTTYIVGRTVSNGKERIVFYDNNYKTRRNNGFSEPQVLEERDSLFNYIINFGDPETIPGLSIAVGSDGTIHVVWAVPFTESSNYYPFGALRENLFYQRKTENGWLGNPVQLTFAEYMTGCPTSPTITKIERYFNPQIAIGTDGLVHLIAEYFEALYDCNSNSSNQKGLKYIQIDSLLSITENNILLQPDQDWEIIDHRFALKSGNLPNIVWTKKNNTGPKENQINYAGRQPAGNWSIQEDIGIGANDKWADIAIDSEDNVWIVYGSDPDLPTGRIKSVKNLGATHESVSTVPGTHPRIVIDFQDQPIVAWSTIDFVNIQPNDHIGFAARINHPGIPANDPWVGRQPKAQIIQADDLFWLRPLEMAIKEHDGIELLCFQEEAYSILYSQTIDFNVGLNNSPSSRAVAPNAGVIGINGSLSATIPLFVTRGAGFAASSTLIYNSGDLRPGTISPGWTHNYHIYLVDSWTAIQTAYSVFGHIKDIITLFQGDGSSVVFRYIDSLDYHIAEKEFGHFGRIRRENNTLATTYTLIVEDSTQYFFDQTGKLIQIQSPDGNTLTFTHQNGQLTKITDSMNRETGLAYNMSQQLKTITDPAGKAYELSYDTQNRLEKVDFKGAPPGQPVAVGFKYHGNNNPVSIDNIPDVNNRENLLAKIITPRGNLENYSYDLYYLKDGRCRLAQQPPADYLEEDGNMLVEWLNYRAKFVISYLDSLPAHNQAVLLRNRRDIDTKIVYERRRNLLQSRIDPEDCVAKWKYGDFRNLIEFTDPNGAVTKYQYFLPSESTPPYIGNNLKTVMRPDGMPLGPQTHFEAAKFTYTADGFNLINTVTDCRGSVTTYLRDTLGRIREILYPTDTLADNMTIQNLTESLTYNGMSMVETHTGERDNLTQVLNFDPPTGLPKQIRRPDAAQFGEIGYHIMGYDTSYQKPTGGSATSILDGIYRTVQIKQPATSAGQHILSIEYDADSNLKKSWDNQHGPGKPIETNTYDRLGRKTALKNARGDEMKYWFDRENNLVSVQDFRGVIDCMYYDSKNRLREALKDGSNPCLSGKMYHRTTYGYDCNGNLTVHTAIGANPVSNQTTQSLFDLRNNRMRTLWSEDTIASEYTYDCNDMLRTTKTGKVTVGSLLSPLTSVESETGFEIDRLYRTKRIHEKLGPLGGGATLTTNLVYRDKGAKPETVDPEGRKTSVTESKRYVGTHFHRHNGNTLMEQKVDDDDRTTLVKIPAAQGQGMDTLIKYFYNARNQVDSLKDAHGNTQKFEYNLRGLPVRIIDEAGFVTVNQYDELNRPTKSIVAQGTPDQRIDSMSYDANGNVTEIVAWNPATKAYNAKYVKVYDNANRLVKLIFPAIPGAVGDQLSMEWRYDTLGNLSYFRDRNGKITRYRYDRINRMTVETHENPNNLAHNRRLEYGYDTRGNLRSLIEREGVEATAPIVYREIYRYDGKSRLIAQKSYVAALSLTEPWQDDIFQYDGASNLVGFIDAEGNTLEFSPNEDNWITGIGGSDGANKFTAYDGAGRRRDEYLGTTSPNDPQGALAKIHYDYDAESRLTAIIATVGTDTVSHISFEYDKRDNRILIRYHHIDTEVNFGYDGREQLTSENWIMVAPEDCGNLQDILPQVATAGVAAFLPGTPANGLPPNVKFYTAAYKYDPPGNRLEQIINGRLTTYTYNAQNQLTAVTPDEGDPATYQYDDNGNQIRCTRGNVVESFLPDWKNRITRYRKTQNGAVQVDFEYHYTPFTNRLAQKNLIADSTAWFKYFGADVYADFVQAGTTAPVPTVRYFNGLSIDAKWGRINLNPDGSPAAGPDAKHFYLPDALGGVHQVLNGAGQVVNLQLTNAWGVPMPLDFIALAYGIQDRYRGLAQREIDAESGLQFTRARHYDPATGRFLGVDPVLGNVVSDHYAYASGNPVGRVDAWGMQDYPPRIKDLWESHDGHYGQMFKEAFKSRIKFLQPGTLKGEFAAEDRHELLCNTIETMGHAFVAGLTFVIPGGKGTLKIGKNIFRIFGHSTVSLVFGGLEEGTKEFFRQLLVTPIKLALDKINIGVDNTIEKPIKKFVQKMIKEGGEQAIDNLSREIANVLIDEDNNEKLDEMGFKSDMLEHLVATLGENYIMPIKYGSVSSIIVLEDVRDNVNIYRKYIFWKEDRTLPTGEKQPTSVPYRGENSIDLFHDQYGIASVWFRAGITKNIKERPFCFMGMGELYYELDFDALFRFQPIPK